MHANPLATMRQMLGALTLAFVVTACGATLASATPDIARKEAPMLSELVAKGYPDLGWDPVEGERYLDFLRFCVWVGGETRGPHSAPLSSVSSAPVLCPLSSAGCF